MSSWPVFHLPASLKRQQSSYFPTEQTGSWATCIFPGTPVLSILLATLTVFPQMSYWGRRAPITPATTGPTLMPEQTGENVKSETTASCALSQPQSDSLCDCLQHSGGRTHSQDELIVRLIVDFIQNVKHFNGVVGYCAQMVVNRFFGL